MPDKLYTTNQLAKLFGVVPTTVIDWIERGKLEAFKTLGGHRRITHQAVIDFLAANRLPSPPAFLSESASGNGRGRSGALLALISEDAAWAQATAAFLTRELSPARLVEQHHPLTGLLAIGANRPAVVVLDRWVGSHGAEEIGRQVKLYLGAERVRIIALTDGEPGSAFGVADAVVPRQAMSALVETCRSFLGPTPAADPPATPAPAAAGE